MIDTLPERRWRRVAWSMRVGAFYDAAFALAILGWARPAGRFLGVPVPDDSLYLRLDGILLLVLAGCYALPAFAPVRYQGIVGVAAGGRLLGAAFLGSAYARGAAPAFLVLAAADLAFALVHGSFLALARRAARPHSPNGATP